MIRGKDCIRCGSDEWTKNMKGWRCAICNRAQNVRWHAKTSSDDPVFMVWRRARGRAREKQVPFTILLEDVHRAWPADGRCPALGIVLERGVGRNKPSSPSLDRINPEWGYEPGNIAVLSHAANTIKSNRQAKELDRVAAWMRRVGMD